MKQVALMPTQASMDSIRDNHLADSSNAPQSTGVRDPEPAVDEPPPLLELSSLDVLAICGSPTSTIELIDLCDEHDCQVTAENNYTKQQEDFGMQVISESGDQVCVKLDSSSYSSELQLHYSPPAAGSDDCYAKIVELRESMKQKIQQAQIVLTDAITKLRAKLTDG